MSTGFDRGAVVRWTVALVLVTGLTHPTLAGPGQRGHGGQVGGHPSPYSITRRPMSQTPPPAVTQRFKRGGYCPGDYGRDRFESTFSTPRLRSIYEWSANGYCPDWAGFAPDVSIFWRERAEADAAAEVLIPSLVEFEEAAEPPPAPYENLVRQTPRRIMPPVEETDDGWELLAEGRARDAIRAFARDGRADPTNARAKLGHALAAALLDDSGRVEWAVRAAIVNDDGSLRRAPMDDAHRALIRERIARRDAAAAGRRGTDRDDRFVAGALRYVLGEDEAARETIAAVAPAGDPALERLARLLDTADASPAGPDDDPARLVRGPAPEQTTKSEQLITNN